MRSGEPLTRKRLLAWTAALGAVLALSVLAGVSWGTGSLSLVDLLPGGSSLSEQARAVFFDVRLPRVLAAALLARQLAAGRDRLLGIDTLGVQELGRSSAGRSALSVVVPVDRLRHQSPPTSRTPVAVNLTSPSDAVSTETLPCA